MEEKKWIALICENREDFLKQIDTFPDAVIKNKSTKQFETSTKIYHRVSDWRHVHSITFDSAIFTDNAIWNPDLKKIIEILRPSLKRREK